MDTKMQIATFAQFNSTTGEAREYVSSFIGENADGETIENAYREFKDQIDGELDEEFDGRIIFDGSTFYGPASITDEEIAEFMDETQDIIEDIDLGEIYASVMPETDPNHES